MSELKVYRTTLKLPEGKILNAGVYRKSEVDKLIAELKKEKEYIIESTTEVINAQEREIRHHKYKRCLDKAERCEVTARFYGNSVSKVLNRDITDPKRQKVFRRLRHYQKWNKRWLEIAEQFKEVK